MQTQTDKENKLIWQGLYRIRQFVVGSMTILEVDGREVKVGSTKIYTEELSVDKLRFICRVKIPVEKNILLGLQFVVSDQVLTFKARIQGVHANEKKKKYTYLVEFETTDDDERQPILTFVNKIQLANKQKKLRSVTEIAAEID